MPALAHSVSLKSIAAVIGGGRTFTPLSLFSAGEVGAWYDPSDFSTMFQDAAGTTPVTAVEQPVGLILDKSKSLTLGSELVTNGTFDTNLNGWTNNGTVTASWTANGASVTRNASGDLIYQAVSCTVGRTYLVSAEVKSGTLARIGFNSAIVGGVGELTLAGGVGVYTGRVVATATTMYVLLGLAANAQTAVFDNVTVKELAGNHASQTTSTSRPVLRATTRIDYDGTDDKLTCSTAGAGTTGFLFVAGINIDVTGAAQTVWSDTGTNTGYRVRINASNQLELAAGNGTAYTTVTTTETLSAGTNYVIAAWHDGTNLNVRIGSGAIASQAFATATAGTAGFTIGMDNGAVSSQLNGKVYNAVYVKNFAGSVTAVNNTISYVNGKLA